MPTYITNLLHQHNHKLPSRPVHAPSIFTYPTIKQPIQLTAPPDMSKPLNPKQIQYTQKIIGSLLYYARAVDPTMLVAIGDIAAHQTQGTEKTLQAVHL